MCVTRGLIRSRVGSFAPPCRFLTRRVLVCEKAIYYFHVWNIFLFAVHYRAFDRSVLFLTHKSPRINLPGSVFSPLPRVVWVLKFISSTANCQCQHPFTSLIPNRWFRTPPSPPPPHYSSPILLLRWRFGSWGLGCLVPGAVLSVRNKLNLISQLLIHSIFSFCI